MKQRIIAIDVLRGFALLGILLMNMSSFAMPSMAYFNPTVYGGNDVWNRLLFSLSHVFADQKMMALFSMLFGASVILVTGNMEKRGKSAFGFHYIRNFWLLIIGLIHSIFIWDGDILVIYAVCSFVLYWLRKLSPKWQFGLGLFIFFVPSLLNLWISTTLPYLQPADVQYLESYWQPDETAVSTETQLYQGTYPEQVIYRLEADTAVVPYTNGQGLLELSLLTEFFARALGMMLVGMAFYTWGILTAKRSDAFYIRMTQIGFGVGLPIVLVSLFQYTGHDWGALYSLFNGRIPNHIATPFIASGYIALIMLWSRSNTFASLRDKLAAVGRMALTNYIGQSIIGTFIFYGFGLGLFGTLSRVQQFLVILLIWAIQIRLSSWWLNHFQYGPLEWVWRMLSHRRWQPLQKSSIVSA
ncbi:MAG: DUF418 domain-containing protein [Chloroflexi bacterium]|nr:MAG: DUF418 domain-containing protein [Chloroflexota bacterium]